jgi:transposase
MQTKRDRQTIEMMLLPPLESFIPEDHYLRRLDKVLDLGFVHEAVRERYCQDNGRPSIDPEVVLRLFLLQAIAGIGRVRELMRQVQVNLAYRWFIGYELTEKLPDHSTLSKALARFGDEIFNDLFERSIAKCQESGLIEGKVLHIDATTIRADLDRERVGKEDSPDPDARYGKFPGKRLAPGYKQHTVADGKSRVVMGVSVTPADRQEHTAALPLLNEAVKYLPKPPEAICADRAYASGYHYVKLAERGTRLISPPPQAKTYTGDKYYSVEDFEYDEAKDLFVCPAGKLLKHVYMEKERGRRIYRALRSACRSCPLKSRCTSSQQRHLKVTADHAGLVKLRADSKTESFKKLYRTRAPVIEGVFAEAKQWHSLGRAWRRGLSKMRVQCLLIAAVLNFKRLAVANGPLSFVFYQFRTVWQAIWSLMAVTWSLRQNPGAPQPRTVQLSRTKPKMVLFQQAPSGGAPVRGKEGLPQGARYSATTHSRAPAVARQRICGL